MSIFTKKPASQTLEQEHHEAVNDLVQLIKLQGQSFQYHTVAKTDKSRQALENYERMIHSLQIRLVRLGSKINKQAEVEMGK